MVAGGIEDARPFSSAGSERFLVGQMPPAHSAECACFALDDFASIDCGLARAGRVHSHARAGRCIGLPGRDTLPADSRLEAEPGRRHGIPCRRTSAVSRFAGFARRPLDSPVDHPALFAVLACGTAARNSNRLTKSRVPSLLILSYPRLSLENATRWRRNKCHSTLHGYEKNQAQIASLDSARPRWPLSLSRGVMGQANPRAEPSATQAVRQLSRSKIACAHPRPVLYERADRKAASARQAIWPLRRSAPALGQGRIDQRGSRRASSANTWGRGTIPRKRKLWVSPYAETNACSPAKCSGWR